MDNSLIFQFLYINVLNYRYFHTDSSTFLKIKKCWKNKKRQKRVFYRKIKNVYKRLLQLWLLRYEGNTRTHCSDLDRLFELAKINGFSPNAQKYIQQVIEGTVST